jgi:hypothetical protein
MNATDLQAAPLANAVHKALRRFMFDALVAAGSLDTTQPRQVERVLNLVERLLAVLNEPAPALRNAMAALREGAASQRPARAARLYRELSALVTDRLLRLQADEAGGEPRHERQQRLRSLSSDELQDLLEWMTGAVSPQEWAMLMADLRAVGREPVAWARAA